MQYHDGQFDDARLAVALARTAAGHGAAIANYVRAERFVTESGKILPRRVTGMSARLHRKITSEIKRARAALLMK